MSRIPLICLLALYTLGAAAADSCVVLQYHHFSETSPRSTSVTPAEFDAHLDYLADAGYQVLPLRDVVDALQRSTPLPERCVAISVDDAYVSVHTEAFPRLLARGWPFTLFVNTAALDDKVPAYMNWDQLREMVRAGVDLGNHSHSHAHLQRKARGESETEWRQRVRDDIDTAQQRIRQETGLTPVLFAYPYGEYDQRVQTLLREMQLIGFGQQSGPAWRGADFTALPRFPMAAGYAAMPGFRDKVQSLPLPVAEAEPRDPVVPLDSWRPRLGIRLSRDLPNPRGLRCYVSGQEPAQVTWSDNDSRHFVVTPGQNLAVGRNRYNCTAPSEQAGRYYWYSHNFFRREADGGWYPD